MSELKSFDEDEYIEENFTDLDFSGMSFSNIEFDGCTFENCTFHKTHFEHCRFVESHFKMCDLSLMHVNGSVFNDVTLDECKAIGINYSELILPFEMNFHNSNINLSSFYRLELKHAKFLNCSIQEVDFVETNLEKVDFSGSDLLNAVFDSTNLKMTDLSEASNYLIDPQKNFLKKTKVSTEEATSFLQFLDLDLVK